MPPNQRAASRVRPVGGSRGRFGSAETTPAVTASVDAFRRILRALRLAAMKTQMAAGLGAAQLFVLTTLKDGQEASLSEIADRTMTDRSSVASVVERLLEAGLVERGTSRTDRRRAAIGITTEGSRVLRRAPAPPTSLLVDGLERVDPRSLRALAEGLYALTDAMGLSDQRAGMLFEDDKGSAPRPGRRRKVRA